MIKLNKKGQKIVKTSILIIFTISILAMTYNLRAIFNPVLLSLLIAYILNPIVNFFEHLRIRRFITIFNIYLILTSAIVLTIILLIPILSAEISYLYRKTFVGDTYIDKNNNNKYEYVDKNENMKWDNGEGDILIKDIDNNQKYNPSYLRVFLKWLKEVVQSWNKSNPEQKIEWKTIKEELTNKQALKDIGKTFFSFSKGTIKTVVSLFSVLSYIILLPLYTFLLLKSFNGIKKTVYGYLPQANKEEIIRILKRIHKAVSAFFRGRLMICIMKGLLTWGILKILGVKYALLFGIIQTAVSIVPFLVLVVGMVPNIIILLLDMGLNWPYLIAVIFMYSFIEAFEGLVLTPWIMGQETGLHPLTVILALLIGGKLFGLFGLIIAIPLCNTLKILGQEFILPAWKDISKCEGA